MKELTNAFQPYDTPGDALENITNMKMGNNTIEDHTAQFQTEENIGTTSHAKNIG